MRTLGATFVAAVLLFGGAASASAVTGGYGIERSLRGTPLPPPVSSTVRTKAAPSCHSNGPRKKAPTLGDQIVRKFVPVACEQPPRSKVLDLGGSFWFAP